MTQIHGMSFTHSSPAGGSETGGDFTDGSGPKSSGPGAGAVAGAAPGVLIVEDEPRLREMLARALPDMGFRPRTARNAEEALKMLEAEPSPIAMLDLHLPGISGIELFKRIRTRWPDMAVIVLTGYGDLEAAKAAIHLDVVDFLSKPCPLGEIEVALDRARKRITPRGKTKLIELDDAESTSATAADPGEKPAKPTLDAAERVLILDALKRHKGNRTAAAAELDISVRTLYYRLAEYEKQGFEVEG